MTTLLLPDGRIIRGIKRSIAQNAAMRRAARAIAQIFALHIGREISFAISAFVGYATAYCALPGGDQRAIATINTQE